MYAVRRDAYPHYLCEVLVKGFLDINTHWCKLYWARWSKAVGFTNWERKEAKIFHQKDRNFHNPYMIMDK